MRTTCLRLRYGVAVATRALLQQQQRQHRIVLPPLPSTSHSTQQQQQQHRYRNEDDEYATNSTPSPELTAFLDDASANTLRRQLQLDQFHDAASRRLDEVWLHNKSHLRRQERLVRELGVDGAVHETLQPSRPSLASELRQRPLDRGILAEIYTGMHGRRIERRLKKGVLWEHWMARGEGTAPVYTASTRAQRTFAFGGHVTLVRAAAHARQFPLLAWQRGAVVRVDHHHGDRWQRDARPLGHNSSGSSSTRGRALRTSKQPHTLTTSQLLPEMAFIGRTSSGKSSLINALVNAMVSPYGELGGTTDTVRFYAVAQRLLLVDCPGYGFYNPMATPTQDAHNAVRVLHDYLHACSATHPHARRARHAAHHTRRANDLDVDDDDDTDGDSSSGSNNDGDATRRRASPQSPPRNVRRVMVCVPSRPLQPLDLQYCDLLERLALPFTVVLTKTDQVPIRELARVTDYTRSRLVHYRHCKELMLSSALRLAGVDKLQTLIGSFAARDDAPLHGAHDDFDSIV